MGGVSPSKDGFDSMINLSIPDENAPHREKPISLSFNLQIGKFDVHDDDDMLIPDENVLKYGQGPTIGIIPNSNSAVLQRKSLVSPNRHGQGFKGGESFEPNHENKTAEDVGQTIPSNTFSVQRPVVIPEKPKVQMQVQISFTPTTSSIIRENWLQLIPLRLDRMYSRIEEIYPYLHFTSLSALSGFTNTRDKASEEHVWFAGGSTLGPNLMFGEKLSGLNPSYSLQGNRNTTGPDLRAVSVSIEIPTDFKQSAAVLQAFSSLEVRLKQSCLKRRPVCSVWTPQDGFRNKQAGTVVLKVDGDKLVLPIESGNDLMNEGLVSKIVSIVDGM